MLLLLLLLLLLTPALWLWCHGAAQVALPLFEERRRPDVEALIQLMVFSFPWQYSQDRLRRALW